MERISKTALAAMSPEQLLNTFRQMATDYMKEHNCRWSEACLAVKKRYPVEARAAFGAPSLEREQLPA